MQSDDNHAHGVKHDLPLVPQITDLMVRLQRAFIDRELYRRLLGCRGRIAQSLLDSFQWVLDIRGLNTPFRSNLIVATQRLSARTGLYPACYELEGVVQDGPDPIICGGFADIYKGTLYGQAVCLKAVRVYERSQVDKIFKILAKEFILWVQLSHPNILPIYGLYPFMNQVRLVSPWMENGDITKYLKSKPEAARLPLAIDVAQGLSYLHKNNVIHGDLKGVNILIDDLGRARLADFGISGVSDPEIIALTTFSSSHSQGGTVRWQAPELFGAEDDKVVKNSVESDVYAMSCVFYEIYTGDVPYASLINPATVIFKIISGIQPARPLASSPAWDAWGLTESIWSVMEDCWKMQPTQRPSVKQVLQRLLPRLTYDERPNASGRILSSAVFREHMIDMVKLMTASDLDTLLRSDRNAQIEMHTNSIPESISRSSTSFSPAPTVPHPDARAHNGPHGKPTNTIKRHEDSEPMSVNSSDYQSLHDYEMRDIPDMPSSTGGELGHTHQASTLYSNPVASGNRSQSLSPGHSELPHDAWTQVQLQHDPILPVELKISNEGLSPAVLEQSLMSLRPVSYSLDKDSHFTSSFPRQLDVNAARSPYTQYHKSGIFISPTVKQKQKQKLWWNTFLPTHPLSVIERDFTYLFRDTGNWLCFLNLDYFIKTLSDEELRLSIQPAFIYAGLAMAALTKSSEVELKAPGRKHALWLRNTAQTYLDSSMALEWIDTSLAEAALILVLFETSAHPMYNQDRVEQALLTLDFIVRTTSLTTIDANDTDVVHYPAGCVPLVHLDPLADSPDRKGTCIPPDTAQAPNPFSSWSYILPWDPTWTDMEIRDEECRRLCWGALSLMCNYVSQCVAFNRDPPDFFLTNSSNYAILFPGEVLDRVSPTYRGSTSPSTKESVWALYCRIMLLWMFTNRLRTSTVTNDEKVGLIYNVWTEAQSLQDSLRIHNCNLNTTLICMCSEYVYKTQITITQTLHSFEGLGSGLTFSKSNQAEEWLRYQGCMIQTVQSAIGHLSGVQGKQLTRQPYQAMWFASQLSFCLMRWNHDRSLRNALDLAKSILLLVEVMASLWPCLALQRHSSSLRQRLIEACNEVGMVPPMPANYPFPVF